MIRRTARGAGLSKHVTAHTLRHTAATWLRQATGDTRLVAEYLGHADLSTVNRYVHLASEEIHAAVQTLADQACMSFVPTRLAGGHEASEDRPWQRARPASAWAGTRRDLSATQQTSQSDHKIVELSVADIGQPVGAARWTLVLTRGVVDLEKIVHNLPDVVRATARVALAHVQDDDTRVVRAGGGLHGERQPVPLREVYAADDWSQRTR